MQVNLIIQHPGYSFKCSVGTRSTAVNTYLDIEFYLFFLQFEEQLLHAKCTCKVLIMNIIVKGPNPFCAI